MYLGCCCDVSQGPVGGTGINGFPGLRVSNSFGIILFFIYVPCFSCKIDIMINPLFKITVMLLSLLVLVACLLSTYLFVCFCGSSVFTTVTDDHQ